MLNSDIFTQNYTGSYVELNKKVCNSTATLKDPAVCSAVKFAVKLSVAVNLPAQLKHPRCAKALTFPEASRYLPITEPQKGVPSEPELG